MATQAQIEYVQAVRRAHGVQNKKLPKKIRPILYPHSIEIKYAAELIDFVVYMRGVVNQIVVPEIPNYVSESDASRPHREKNDSIRLDAWPTELKRTMGTASEEVNQSPKKPNSEDVEQIGEEVAAFSKNQFDQTMNQALGVDVYVPDTWLELEIESYVGQNLSLIESVEGQYLRQVEEAVNRGIQEGDRAEDIAEELEKIGDVTESRAKLIARDQVGKLNGNLNMLRQESLGVEEYIWRDSDDQRVRGDPDGIYPNAIPSHFAKNGEKFRWDTPPPDTGHPGQDYQCRCYGEPILDDFLEGI